MEQDPKMPPKMPSLAEMAFNLTDQLKNTLESVVKQGVLLVEDSKFQERKQICIGCESFEPAQSRCLKCGCFMNLKARFAGSVCPMQKW